MSFTLALENIASGEIIDLSDQSASDDGIGAEATSGATGFGLPSVDVKWADGAGDGSRYRGTRVLPRELDLNIDFVAEGEDQLQAQLDKLSRVLSSECLLWATNRHGARRWVRVVRTGGGDFATGMDTNGETEMSLSVTLRAGQPFWVSETPTEVRVAGGEIGTTLAVDNEGTADARPVWRVTGPANGFSISLNDSEERIVFTEFVDSGVTITVDTANGTVVDTQGRNRYSALGPSPRFFAIPPGLHSVNISMDRSSDQFLARLGGGRVNFVTNPNLSVNTAGWDLSTGTARDAATKRIKAAAIYVANPAAANDGPYVHPVALAAIRTRFATFTSERTIGFSVSDLVQGQTYELRLKVSSKHTTPSGTPTTQISHTADYPSWVGSGSIFVYRYQPGAITLTSGSATMSKPLPGAESEVVFQFVAGGPMATVRVTAPWWAVYDSGSIIYAGKRQSAYYVRGAIIDETTVGMAYLGEPGPYFDGDTTDTSEINYVWSGAPNASISQAVPLSLDTSGSQVACELNPRDWMVV